MQALRNEGFFHAFLGKRREKMGNRCVITDEKRTIGIYLHWNGGIGSVEAFLTYCSMKGCRGFGDDSNYAAARLIQVVGNFFGGTLSLGVSKYTTDEEEDPGDNGIYVIRGWKIVKHLESTEMSDDKGNCSFELRETDIASEKREYKLEEMLKSIDEAQPESCRLGEYLDCDYIDAKDLKIGDSFYLQGVEGTPEKAICCGFGCGVVNGSDRTGIPFGITDTWLEYNKYEGITLEAIAEASRNPNLYARTEKVMALHKEENR